MTDCKQRSEETRQKINEAVKGNQVTKPPSGYKMLIAAVVKQAAKDKATWFFETATGRGYCAAVSIDPYKLIGRQV